MAVTIYNPLGKDYAEVISETAADRVGSRIRAIREDKGFSQTDLGKAVGLTADRIQKYENGVSIPRLDLLMKIAGALGVETIALMDPVVTSHVGVMYALFEMEKLHDLEVKKDGARYYIQFGDGFSGTLNDYLRKWYEELDNMEAHLDNASDEEADSIVKEYHNWERTFPKALSDETQKSLQKARLESTIAELQERLDRLNEE